MSYSSSVIYLDIVRDILLLILDSIASRDFNNISNRIHIILDKLNNFRINSNTIGIIITNSDNVSRVSLDTLLGTKPIITFDNNHIIRIYIVPLLDSVLLSIISIDDLLDTTYMLNITDNITISIKLLNLLKEAKSLYNNLYHYLIKILSNPTYDKNSKIHIFAYKCIIDLYNKKCVNTIPNELILLLYKMIDFINEFIELLSELEIELLHLNIL